MLNTADEVRNKLQAQSRTVNFTFVNQTDDLVSLCHKRISNKEQRQAIRSHVMQRIRQAESEYGKESATDIKRQPSGKRKESPIALTHP